MKIIKYHKEKNGKYKIVLEDGSIIDTYEDVIIKDNILYQKELNKDMIDRIEVDNDYQKIYNSCVKYISIRIRSIKEIRDYLNKKDISLDIQDKVINELLTKKLLNDDIYTELYIKDKINLTNWGPYKIAVNLKENGISNELIDKYLYLYDRVLEEERITKLINKKIKSNHKENINLKNKIYGNLINLGYNADLVLDILNKYL